MITCARMAKSVFQMFLVLMLVTLTGTNDQDNMAGGVESEDPDCSSAEFYCPFNSTKRCKPRTARYLLESERTEQSCLNARTHQEEGCLGNLTTGVFEIWNGWAPTDYKIPIVSHRGYRFKHEYVTYRGLTYDYNLNGAKIHDINDPYYKYKTQTVTEYKEVGTSRCKASDVSSFISQWEEVDFKVIGHNCQDFARQLIQLLKNDCRATQTSTSSDTKIIDARNRDMLSRNDKNSHRNNDGESTPEPNLPRSTQTDVEQDRFTKSNRTRPLVKNGVLVEHIGTYSKCAFVVLGLAVAVLIVQFVVVRVTEKKKQQRQGSRELLEDIE